VPTRKNRQGRPPSRSFKGEGPACDPSPPLMDARRLRTIRRQGAGSKQVVQRTRPWDGAGVGREGKPGRDRSSRTSLETSREKGPSFEATWLALEGAGRRRFSRPGPADLHACRGVKPHWAICKAGKWREAIREGCAHPHARYRRRASHLRTVACMWAKGPAAEIIDLSNRAKLARAARSEATTGLRTVPEGHGCAWEKVCKMK